MMMTDKTKITLSDKEHELVCNTDWILTKHSIINKVTSLFGEVLIPMQRITGNYKNDLLPEIFVKDPKISKGENYQLLPYVILDYPRHFTQNKTVAIRTMFWWGNFFSVSLQLSGNSVARYTPALIANFQLLQQMDYWLCINESPWQHHFKEDNYLLLSTIDAHEFDKLLHQKGFIKIARKISLQHWNTVTLFVEQTFEELIKLLRINYLNDEKDL